MHRISEEGEGGEYGKRDRYVSTLLYMLIGSEDRVVGTRTITCLARSIVRGVPLGLDSANDGAAREREID